MPIEREDVFTELRPYADLAVVPGISVGDLTYVASQAFHSEATFAASSAVIPSSTELAMFYGAEGDSGLQGWTGSLTLAQTNWPYSKGVCSANNVFLGLYLGFDVYLVNSATTSGTLNYFQIDDSYATLATSGGGCLSAVAALCRNFTWDLTQGRGIKRIVGPLDQYPGAEGSYVVGAASGSNSTATGTVQWNAQNGMSGAFKQKLKLPIVFAPLIPTSINVANGSGFTITGLGSTLVVIRATMTGYSMTMPV